MQYKPLPTAGVVLRMGKLVNGKGEISTSVEKKGLD